MTNWCRKALEINTMFGEITLKYHDTIIDRTYGGVRDILFKNFPVKFLSLGRSALVARGLVHPAQVVVHFLEARVISAQPG